MRKIIVTFFALGLAVMLLPSAWAASASLAPGTCIGLGSVACPGTLPNNGSFSTLVSGFTQVGDTGVVALTPGLGSTVSASGQELVYRTGSGTLDFFIQITNNAGTADPLSSVDALNFGGFTTAVGYAIPRTAAQAPTDANRSGGVGNVVNFDFLSAGAPSLTGRSYWLEIDTNATTFGGGVVGVIDQGTASMLAFAPTPEPATTGIVAGALALMALVSRRRLAKKA